MSGAPIMMTDAQRADYFQERFNVLATARRIDRIEVLGETVWFNAEDSSGREHTAEDLEELANKLLLQATYDAQRIHEEETAAANRAKGTITLPQNLPEDL